MLSIMSKSERAAIIGYGLAGRLAALRLLRQGWQVSVYEALPHLGDDPTVTSFSAGGMLAPFSEREHAEALIFQLGMASLELWPQLCEQLSQPVHYQQHGSLIVSHRRDRSLWQHFNSLVYRNLPEGYQSAIETVQAASIEPDLAENFSQALYFPTEAHLDPTELLNALAVENQRLGVDLQLGRPVQYQNLADLEQQIGCFDTYIDCRGMGARQQLDLRGVRGEAILVQAPEVSLIRPIRILHPRYTIYIVPRGKQRFYIGATQIERDELSPITLRSSLELMSAAYAVHPGFSEAAVLRSYVGLRPAFADHQPRIVQEDRLFQVNGLFRHGFLISPVLIDELIRQVYAKADDVTAFSKQLLIRKEL